MKPSPNWKGVYRTSFTFIIMSARIVRFREKHLIRFTGLSCQLSEEVINARFYLSRWNLCPKIGVDLKGPV